MSNFVSKITKVLKQIRGFFPERLPVGLTEFDAWAQDLANTYTLPTQDIESLRFTLASIIMHLGPQAAFRSKFYFLLTVSAAAAKQVAGAAFYEIKQKHLAQQKAAEATANTLVVSDVPRQ